MREADLHVNVVTFLNSTPNGLTLESPVTVSGSNNSILTVDIGLTHPFPQNPEYTGFDVKGIFFGGWYGMVGGENSMPPSYLTTHKGGIISTTNVNMGIGGMNFLPTRLLNADGYTDYWNPREYYPITDPLFSYVPGKLGGNLMLYEPYRVTVHPFKVFAYGLAAGDTLEGVQDSDRLYFPAGSKLVRRYIIDYGYNLYDTKFLFNYAVDASWEAPNHIPPTSVPGDFPIEANQPEPVIRAFNVTSNTLTTRGGSIDVNISAFDHQGDNLTVEVIAPQVAVGKMPLAPQGDGTWSGTIVNHIGPEAYYIAGALPGYVSLWLIVTDDKDNISVDVTYPAVAQVANGDFSAPNLIATGGAGAFMYRKPACVRDSSGRLHVVCLKYFDPDTPSQLVYWRSDQGIVHTIDVATPSGWTTRAIDNPDITIDPATGNVVMSFYQWFMQDSGSGSNHRSSFVSFSGNPPIPFTPTPLSDIQCESWSRPVVTSSTQVYSCWKEQTVIPDAELMGGIGLPPSTHTQLTLDPDFYPYGFDMALCGASPVLLYMNDAAYGSSDPSQVVFKNGFTAPGVSETVLEQIPKEADYYPIARNLSIAGNGSEICAAWALDSGTKIASGIRFNRFDSGSPPDPSDTDYLVWDIWGDGAARSLVCPLVRYDIDANGMIFWCLEEGFQEPLALWLSYMPGSTPVLDVGPITDLQAPYPSSSGDFYLYTAEVDQATGEIAVVYVGADEGLHYVTAMP
jgi:hypothetical protein